MKRLKIYTLAALMLLSAGSVCFASDTEVIAANGEKTSGEPAIKFTEKDYNFGVIAEKGGPVSHSFEFTNTGTAPLVIISATASCGCTRPSYPTEPIAPGKKGVIKVTYLPDGRPGEFDKVIKVRTNAKESKKVSLKIRGTVSSKK